MNFKFKIYLLIVVCFSFVACEKEVPQRDVDAEIQSLMDVYNLPSVSASIVRNGEVVWQKSYGYAVVGDKIPADSGTIYHVASISKLVVVTATMQLVEKGFIDIDKDINEYLPVDIIHPYFPETSITPRMLMTHSAGIAWPQTMQEAGLLWEQFPPDQAPSPSEWVPQFLVAEGEYYNPSIWKNTRPGTFEHYSNIGFNVLAYIVEQVSGKDFRQYCRLSIFLPLGMENTSYNYGDLSYERLAKLYRDNYSIRPFFDDRLYAAGGLKTSVSDLNRFIMAYLAWGELNEVRILEDETVRNIFEMQNAVSGVCLGWQKSIGNWYGHIGGIEGAATATDIHPEDGIGIVIFCNVHNSVVYPGHELYGVIRQHANSFRN